MTKYKTGSIVTGAVTGIENYGIFVSLDDYYSGLIHISEISNNFVKNIEDVVKVGEIINAKVLSVDDDTFHLKLSIKGINYRPKKINSKKIEEVGSGFGILQDNLESWIETAKKSENDKKN